MIIGPCKSIQDVLVAVLAVLVSGAAAADEKTSAIPAPPAPTVAAVSYKCTVILTCNNAGGEPESTPFSGRASQMFLATSIARSKAYAYSRLPGNCYSSPEIGPEDCEIESAMGDGLANREGLSAATTSPWVVRYTFKTGAGNSEFLIVDGDTFCEAYTIARNVVCQHAAELGGVCCCSYCILQRPCCCSCGQ